MGEKRSIFSATLGQVERRLDQLTNPTFDRGTVEVLLSGIMGLMKAEIGANAEINRLAKELAEAHNEIDELNEAIDGYEAEAITGRMTMAALRNENRMLYEQLAACGCRAMKPLPLVKPLEYRADDDPLNGMIADEERKRRMGSQLLKRALPDHFQGD